MGPVPFGAALIAAPKSLNGSLDVTFFELGQRTSVFTSSDIGRHVLKVGTLDVMFFEFGHLNWILDQKKLCGLKNGRPEAQAGVVRSATIVCRKADEAECDPALARAKHRKKADRPYLPKGKYSGCWYQCDCRLSDESTKRATSSIVAAMCSRQPPLGGPTVWIIRVRPRCVRLCHLFKSTRTTKLKCRHNSHERYDEYRIVKIAIPT
jgi:hypothetical protein